MRASAVTRPKRVLWVVEINAYGWNRRTLDGGSLFDNRRLARDAARALTLKFGKHYRVRAYVPREER